MKISSSTSNQIKTLRYLQALLQSFIWQCNNKFPKFYKDILNSELYPWTDPEILSGILTHYLRFNKFTIIDSKGFPQTNLFLDNIDWCKLLLERSNQSIDLLFKSMNWFLYDNGLRHERVNTTLYFRWVQLVHLIPPTSKNIITL